VEEMKEENSGKIGEESGEGSGAANYMASMVRKYFFR